MTLTLEQIYTRYGQREFARVIEIKRRNTDDTYEASWQDIEVLSGIKNLYTAVASINYSIPDDNYSFGIVKIGNMKFKAISKNGQFGDETMANSIFNGFIRHKSLIRVRDGFVDKYTDPLNPVEVLTTVFEGFIDGTSTGTKVDKDNIVQELQCVDLLSFLLKENTKSDMGTLSQTTLSDLIYEILNRTTFTDFFTVDSGNITAGYDITLLDLSQYEGQTQLYTIFENLSIGHSIYYVRDGVFYYKPIKDSIATTFEVDEKKIIKLANYDTGAVVVYEKMFWEESSEFYTAPTNIYRKTKTINIEACTNSTQRQNVLNYVGGIVRIKRQKVKLEIPYYPSIFVLDRLGVDYPDILPEDAFIWDVSNWDEAYWREPINASPITNVNWIVRKITHSGFKTTIILEEVI